MVDFELIASYAKDAELYKIVGINLDNPSFLKDSEVTKLLRSGNIKAQKLGEFLSSRCMRYIPDWSPALERYAKVRNLIGELENIKSSLDVLARTTKLYDKLPGATVSMNVTKRPLHLAKWAIAVEEDWASKFACIAMFETGTLDIGPDALLSVMAMSSGNSIYVANGLIQDPSDNNYGVSRILGNLGRPGVVFLVPPQAPRIVAKDSNSWRLINHDRFDGEILDAFTDTSLHLSFTEYEVPLAVPVGAIDADAVILESLISVYDREKWIADLDILRNLANIEFCNRFPERGCNHQCRNQFPLRDGKPSNAMMGFFTDQPVSIDSWNELLDPPERLGDGQIGVIRARNNWQARLATMSVSVQMKYRTSIVPRGQVCNICLCEELWGHEQIIIL